MARRLSDDYEMIRDYHGRYLERHGVKLPKLKGPRGYTQAALVLVYLAKGYPRTGPASEFIRQYYPNVPDAHKERHLAAQKCNRAERNNWVYDDRVRVIKPANPAAIKNSDKEIGRKAYRILYEKFRGVNPEYVEIAMKMLEEAEKTPRLF